MSLDAGITQPSVAAWGEELPPLRQLQIQSITLGKLKASPVVFEIPTLRHENAA